MIFFKLLNTLHPGERKRAVYLFYFLLSIITSLLLIKPVSSAIFINNVGISHLPNVFILVGLCSFFFVLTYNRLSHYLNIFQLVQTGLVVSIISLIFFWWALKKHENLQWVYYAFYIWVAMFAVIITSQFWLLANTFFHAREAKRVYPFLGMGGILGGIIGGYLTSGLAKWMGSENLLLVSASILGGCIPLVTFAIKKNAPIEFFKTFKWGIANKAKNDLETNSFKLVVKSKYLRNISFIVLLTIICASLVDYQFSSIAANHLTDPDDLTAFFGFWVSTISVISLAIQFFLTQPLIRKWGVSQTLLVLPGGILLGTLGILVSPTLLAGAFSKSLTAGFRNATNKSAMELLSLPIPAAIKNPVKTFIDVFIDNLAMGISGVLLIIIVDKLSFSVELVGLVILAAIFLWVSLIYMVKKEYIQAFRVAIEKRQIDFDINPSSLQLGALINTVVQNHTFYNSRQLLFILDKLGKVHHKKLLPVYKFLLGHKNVDVKISVIRLLESYPKENWHDQVEPLIFQPDQDLSITAMRYVLKHATNPIAKISLYLEHPTQRIQLFAFYCMAINSEQNNDTDLNQKGWSVLEKLHKASLQKEHANGKDEQSIKIIISRAVGASKTLKWNQFLIPYLNDVSLEVQKEAILSAGLLKDESLIKPLINKLSQPEVRRITRQALANYGPSIITTLEKTFQEDNCDHKLRNNIIKTLGYLPYAKSIQTLLGFCKLPISPTERTFVFNALISLKTNFPSLKFTNEITDSLFVEETNRYKQLTLALDVQRTFLQSTNIKTESSSLSTTLIQARKLLIDALHEKTNQTMNRIFQLLALNFPINDIFSVRDGLTSEKPEMRSNVLEFLENILSRKKRDETLPLIEAHYKIENTKALTNISSQKQLTPTDSLSHLLNQTKSWHEPWIESCIIWLWGVTLISMKTDCVVLKMHLKHRDPVVRETVNSIFKLASDVI